MTNGPTPPATPPADAAPPEPQEAMPREMLSKWWARIEASDQAITTYKAEWKKNIDAYMAKVLDSLPKDHVVNVPLEFAYVELKKAQLAFQVPEFYLKPLLPGLEGAVPVFQGAVNHELGPDGADLKTTIDEATTDVLTCSIAGTEIGYNCDLRTRQVQAMMPGPIDLMTGAPGPPVPATRPVFDQETRLPIMDPATGQPQTEPVMEDEQYCAHEEYFWDRFPVEDLIIPTDFTKTNFDKASFLARRFTQDLESGKKQYKLPADFHATVTQPRETLSSSERPDPGVPSYLEIEGFIVWYQTIIFEPDSDALPGQYSKLVLIKGLTDRPAEWKRSPFQYLGPDGKLAGMEGNPIHPLTLRFLPGSAYPVGDVSIARPISEELSTGRSQQIRFRDRAMPMRWGNRDAMDPETAKKIESGDIMDTIWLNANGSESLGIVALPQMPRETNSTNAMVMEDYNRTWAAGATPGAVVQPESRTATEVQSAQGTADVRLDAERTRILNWLCKGARKFGSLLQQFKDSKGYAEIVGADGVKALQAWDMQAIQGKYAFRAKPDSALRVDADVERRQALALYNLLGKDPNVNRVELLTSVLQKHNLDPHKIVVQTPPPTPHPDAAKINFSFKGDDLGNPMVLAILQQCGIQLPTPQELAGMPSAPEQAVPPGQQPSPPHPGAVPSAEPLSKHAMDAAHGPLM
jgi:hypothetical protein